MNSQEFFYFIRHFTVYYYFASDGIELITVEVYLLDMELMDFFPEATQKKIWSKLLNAFEADRPYTLRNV